MCYSTQTICVYFNNSIGLYIRLDMNIPITVFRARLDSPSKGGALLLGPALSHHGSGELTNRGLLSCLVVIC